MGEKLISFAVPSYNSEAYMRKCIDSVLTGGEDVEIIIVDDGSQDETPVVSCGTKMSGMMPPPPVPGSPSPRTRTPWPLSMPAGMRTFRRLRVFI